MPFSSQFALSLELTRLIPLGQAVDKATHEVMKFARALRNTGSDILVEADLAEFFGRCRIAQNMESSFRTVVSVSGGISYLSDELSLATGPGPTVSRSFRPDQGHYLSTIIQCSLLASVHNTNSLAGAIIFAMDQRQQTAGQTDSQVTLASRISLISVAARLGLDEPEAVDPIQPPLIRALTLMLPLAQTLPQDREIVINWPAGTCILVVWAHHVLGLDVAVETPERNGSGQPNSNVSKIYFGRSPATVTIRMPADSGPPLSPSVVLLECSSQEALFSILPDPMEEGIITSSAKQAARGSAIRILEARAVDLSITDKINVPEGCIHELMLMSIALAVRVSKHLFKRLRVDEGASATSYDAYARAASPNREDLERRTQDWHRFHVPEIKLLEAAKFLFNRPDIPQAELTTYIHAHRMIKTREIPEPPTYSMLHEQARTVLAYKEDFRTRIAHLSVLLLVFAHLVNLGEAEDFLINRNLFPGDSEIRYLSKSIWEWDGKKPMHIKSATWFRSFLEFTAHESSNRDHLDAPNASLVSIRGWSIYLPTFGMPDPCDVDPGTFFLKRGVPCKNGVRRRLVLDHRTFEGVRVGTMASEEPVYTAGDRIDLQSKSRTSFGRAFCGEEGDAFLVSLRLVQNWGKEEPILTGHRHLYNTAWEMMSTSQCTHFPGSGPDDKFLIPLGTCAISNLSEITRAGAGDGIQHFILLTAGNPAARWTALNVWLPVNLQQDKFTLIVRTRECCCVCAIKQSFLIYKKSVLVL